MIKSKALATDNILGGLTPGMTGRANGTERNHKKSASRAPVHPVVRPVFRECATAEI